LEVLQQWQVGNSRFRLCFLNFKILLGSVLAVFISFGVPANHLIAASVMAAPGALGFAKLLLPETHQTKTSWEVVQNVPLPYVSLPV
jgi:nucleoside permease NupC